MRDSERDSGTARGEDGVNKQADALGWHEVKRRRTEQTQNRTDVARNYQYYKKEEKRTSYFFTNFPENFKAKHMLKAFLKYGEFEEVVIPAKRDKRGKRFGFARAVGVSDPENFAIKLDNIIIGRDKIMVNLTRFDRHRSEKKDALSTQKKTEGWRNTDQRQPVHTPNQPHLTTSKPSTLEKACPKTTFDPKNQPGTSNPSKSYRPKNQLSRRQQTQKKNLGYIPPPRPKRPWDHRTFNIEEAQVKKLENAFVGVVKKPGLSYRIQEEFAQQ